MTTSIVTGASRGLGLGIARALAEAGHAVVLAARDERRLSAAARTIDSQTVAVATDITSPEEVDRLVEATVERFGSIDVLVNAAGAPPVVDELRELTAERFRLGLDVDVAGTLLLTRAAAARMEAGGTVVNLIAARGGTPAARSPVGGSLAGGPVRADSQSRGHSAS